MIRGHVEETLDLARVQIHGEEAVGAGGGDQVRHQPGGDGRAGSDFPVLPRIPEIGHHGGDRCRRCPAGSVDHDQQLHQVVVHRGGSALDQEDVPAADVFGDLDLDLAVRELAHVAASDGDLQVVADLLHQRLVRVAGEDDEVLLGFAHGAPSTRFTRQPQQPAQEAFRAPTPCRTRRG